MVVCSLMADNSATVPDYDLAEKLELTTPAQVRAISHPLRTTILGLLHERAASVTEVATALARPKSTVAYHLQVLRDAHLVRVIRTRRVRAVEERYYGRTARMFFVGVGDRGRRADLPADFNDFDIAAQESQQAYRTHALRSFIRHARIAPEQASEFWRRALPLIREFESLPRSGSTAYGFVMGVYPIPDYPVLPEVGETD